MITSPEKFILQMYNKEIPDECIGGEFYCQTSSPQLELVAFNEMYNSFNPI